MLVARREHFKDGHEVMDRPRKLRREPNRAPEASLLFYHKLRRILETITFQAFNWFIKKVLINLLAMTDLVNIISSMYQ